MALRLAASFRFAAAEPPSMVAWPSFTTSIYETRRGLAALTWFRAAFGLALHAEFRLSDDEPFTFSLRPSLLWGRRGSRYRVRDDRRVDFAWDLSRLAFSSGRSVRPEPACGFFVAVSVAVDGEMLLVAGDLVEACRKTRDRRPKAPFFTSASGHASGAGSVRGPLRPRHVPHSGAVLGAGAWDLDRLGYQGKRTGFWDVGGRRRRAGFPRALQIGGCAGMQVSWDLHAGVRAVFLFRFKDDESLISLGKDLDFDED